MLLLSQIFKDSNKTLPGNLKHITLSNRQNHRLCCASTGSESHTQSPHIGALVITFACAIAALYTLLPLDVFGVHNTSECNTRCLHCFYHSIIGLNILVETCGSFLVENFQLFSIDSYQFLTAIVDIIRGSSCSMLVLS